MIIIHSPVRYFCSPDIDTHCFNPQGFFKHSLTWCNVNSNPWEEKKPKGFNNLQKWRSLSSEISKINLENKLLVYIHCLSYNDMRTDKIDICPGECGHYYIKLW